jgi:hypothetical protein
MADEQRDDLCSLYGPIQNPFYIYAPRWVNSSAGIKALHFLCHSLNQVGQSAYLVLADDFHGMKSRINGKLNTPILTQEIAQAHFDAGLKPITIYSETIRGNPVGANFVVRFIANYLGKLGGPSEFPENDFILAYSKKLATHASKILNRSDVFTLFFHAIDPREFQPHTLKDDFFLYYAAKYRLFIGKPRIPAGINAIEIVRDGPNAQPRGEVLQLLRSARGLIAYENSAVVIEAILSGTPAILIRSEFFHEGIAEEEVSMLGMRWGFSNENLDAARSELLDAQILFSSSVSKYFAKLNEFIHAVQIQSGKLPYTTVIRVPEYKHIFSRHRLSLAIGVLRTQGLARLLIIIISYINRRIFEKKIER